MADGKRTESERKELVKKIQRYYKKGKSIAWACRKVGIERKTYYRYKDRLDNQTGLKDRRVKDFSEVQKTFLELLIFINPDGSITEYKEALERIRIVFPNDGIRPTRTRIWEYLLERRDYKSPTTRRKRRNAAIDKYGKVIRKDLRQMDHLKIWHQILVPVGKYTMEEWPEYKRKTIKELSRPTDSPETELCKMLDIMIDTPADFNADDTFYIMSVIKNNSEFDWSIALSKLVKLSRKEPDLFTSRIVDDLIQLVS